MAGPTILSEIIHQAMDISKSNNQNNHMGTTTRTGGGGGGGTRGGLVVWDPQRSSCWPRCPCCPQTPPPRRTS